MDEVFGNHARRVAARLKQQGVRHLITVDPHTTDMLHQVYPRFVRDFDIEVQSYLEVLAQAHPKAAEPVNGEVVVHDSCVYARYEKMVDQPRELLRAAGLAVRDPELSGKSTHCCNGPLESLFPAEAHRISGIRVDQLESEGKNVVTMCPICRVNLTKAAGNRLVINDIANTLAARRRQALPKG
ncbi:MAG: heterodisulfide reductase-related iron-sulfur binding cluster [Burkholderiales bacterium]